jgi:DNA-binding beta-propeller fold protein YncE
MEKVVCRSGKTLASLLIYFVGIVLLETTVAAGETPSLNHLFAVRDAARDESLVRPASIAVDTLQGEVYLSDRNRKEILIYSEEGYFLQRIGRDSGIQIPFHLAVNPTGDLIVSEQDLPEIVFLETSGTPKAKFELKIDNSTDFLSGGITVGSDGNVYLVERFGRNIVRIDRKTGGVEKFFSDTISSLGEIEFQDVVTTRDGKIIAVSSKGHAIHVLDDTGNVLKQFGTHGSKAKNFSFPTAAAIGPEGTIWVVDTFQHSIKVFHPDGSFYGEFGEMGTDEGKFFFPIDIAFGKGRKLFVLEKGIPRFQAFELQYPDEGEEK